MKQIKYEDIFGSLGEQIKAVKVWRKIFKLRERKLEERKLSLGHQEHHQSASLRGSRQQGVDLSHQDSSTNVDLMYQYDLGYCQAQPKIQLSWADLALILTYPASASSVVG